MILIKEILQGNSIDGLSQEVKDNIAELLSKINKIRVLWNKPMTVTSGLRSMEHHIDVYKDLAKQRKVPFDIKKVPMSSAHLKGAAVDISDSDGSLYQWCQDNKKALEDIGLWCEIKDDQSRVHFQIYAPKSGNRFFNP